jgi:hypothetical protein
MRVTSVLVLLALATSACFTELPELPAATGTEGSTSTGTSGSETSGASETSAPTTAVESTISDEDPDSAGEVGTSTGALEEGLFACESEALCPVWTLPNCPADCAADAVGTCVLERLRQRSGPSAMLQVQRCAGECTLEVLLPRGSGTADVDRQRASISAEDVLSDYDAPRKCQLRDEAFFAACLAEFTPPCADPEQWFEACAPVSEASCGG